MGDRQRPKRTMMKWINTLLTMRMQRTEEMGSMEAVVGNVQRPNVPEAFGQTRWHSCEHSKHELWHLQTRSQSDAHHMRHSRPLSREPRVVRRDRNEREMGESKEVVEWNGEKSQL